MDAILDDTGTAGVVVASIANNAITANAIATGAIDADALAADALTAAKVAADVGTEIATAVWASADRQLTALDEDVTTIDINNTAIGSVAGNVGGNVTGSVGSVAGNVTGSVGSIATGGITATSIATGAIDADALAADAIDEILDEVVEGTVTLRQAVRLFLATLTAKCSGGGTTTITFRDIGDTKDRIIMTVDSSGNRTAVGTRDGS